MIEITKKDYYKKHKDFRGVFSREEYPEFVGKRTMLSYDHGTCLLIEGVHFNIID